MSDRQAVQAFTRDQCGAPSSHEASEPPAMAEAVSGSQRYKVVHLGYQLFGGCGKLLYRTHLFIAGLLYYHIYCRSDDGNDKEANEKLKEQMILLFHSINLLLNADSIIYSISHQASCVKCYYSAIPELHKTFELCAILMYNKLSFVFWREKMICFLSLVRDMPPFKHRPNDHMENAAVKDMEKAVISEQLM